MDSSEQFLSVFQLSSECETLIPLLPISKERRKPRVILIQRTRMGPTGKALINAFLTCEWEALK